MSKNLKEILTMVLLTGTALLAFSWFMNQKNGPISDPADDSMWDEAGFDFATSTPEIDLMAEGGWWEDVATKKPDALPTLPEIDLLDATVTPLPATQTALALTPSATSTRTPLYDVNATEISPTSTLTPTEDQ